MVDNSFEGDYHNEVQLRSALENEIKNMGKDQLLLGTGQKAYEPEDDMSGQYYDAIKDLRQSCTVLHRLTYIVLFVSAILCK